MAEIETRLASAAPDPGPADTNATGSEPRNDAGNRRWVVRTRLLQQVSSRNSGDPSTDDDDVHVNIFREFRELGNARRIDPVRSGLHGKVPRGPPMLSCAEG